MRATKLRRDPRSRRLPSRDERRPIGPGDFIFVEAEVPHRFENFSDDLTLWALSFSACGGARCPTVRQTRWIARSAARCFVAAASPRHFVIERGALDPPMTR